MKAVIAAAKRAHAAGDYSVGSVVTKAEVIAICGASAILRTRDLSSCVLCSTHEPCPMCMSAAIWARIGTIVFGATMEDHKRHRDMHGNETWPWRVIDIPAREIAERSASKVKIIDGYMRDACLDQFQECDDA
jgi:tRNA(Arg) A34 adenosine deaminase TadA